MQILDSYGDLAANIRRGTVLWRSFGVSTTRYDATVVRIAEVPFASTERSFMGRVEFSGGWLFEPIVWYNDDPTVRPHGMVVFLDTLPAPDWTHLVVTGVARNGKSLFAKDGGPIPTPDQYRSFCEASFRTMKPLLNAPVEEKIEAAKNLRVELPPGCCRLICQGKWMRACPTTGNRQGYVPAIHYIEG